ncbi:MAG: sigma-54-dependent Fis family transcriptional regulator [Acidobacteria bacterium SCN 69-37]|nr:MAG: sigma-54-dependent Fis family transcriptional regulator [Acidobacteria bacterium SCN 69-37]
MILLIDDEPSVTASLALLLKQAGHRATAVATPDAALDALARERCDLVIQDMNFSRRTSGDEGMALLGQIRTRHPDLPVILITAWGSIDLAVRGMKAGASDFITKPWSNQQVMQTVHTVLGIEQARAAGRGDDVPTREALDERYDFGRIVGQSLALRRVLQLVGRVAATDASVLVTGESGTGKELIAEALHANSRRAGRPFVKVNLGGIAASLFESEMFGHVRGAFTDARTDRKGRFELAHTGTIFLDEIGDLDAASQVKMLRVLQDRTFEVLGSSVRREVDVRVVSATNRPLAEIVAHGAFREDLLYRINLIGVHLPPLRERRDDIPRLTASILQGVAQVYGLGPLTLTDAARRWLQAQPWPGNIRQLRQTVERAVLVSGSPVLDVDEFTKSQEGGHARPPSDPLPPVGTMTVDEMERAMIVKALGHCGGNMSRVAEVLGLSRAALYRRLEKYGIDV